MSLLESQLLSKVIDDNNFYELQKYSLTESDFVAIPEAFSFIKSYVSTYGMSPDYLTVTEKFGDFEYTETTNNIAYMAKALKSNTAKRKMFQLLQEETPKKFEQLDGSQFANWLLGQSESIVEEVNAGDHAGTNLATNGQERLDMYLESKEQGSDKFLPTPYPTINEWLGGGFELGDYITLLAYSNAGKSWISADCGKSAWQAGFGVLDYRPEISREQFMGRFDTLTGNFNNTAMKTGSLLEREEDRYFKHLQTFNGTNTVPYLLKTMEDMPKGLSLDLLESDLQQNPDIDMVIIDGFLLMDHKGSNREALSGTSRKLRQLFSRYKVTGIVVHQTPTSAEKDLQSSAEESRIPEAPKLTDYSETVAVIQDAVTVMTFAQKDGVGVLNLRKTKTPNVDRQVELHCKFNMGTIEERTILDDI